MVDSLNRQ